ncbi:hypothetical protein CASFOL_005483 [Castilleja foliolosa]|uniref:Uncharacterized protein n=1 Tax=Castilleja foliolosa TaxID=1961234 RepID=A0ABD3BQS6_9LAMI
MALWSLFRELHSGSTTWGVQARIVRLYKQPNSRNCTEVGSVEMILHDAEKNKGSELMEVSNKADVRKGKGVLIEDAEHDFFEKEGEEEGEQQPLLEGIANENDDDNDDGAKSEEPKSFKVAEKPINQQRESEATKDATYALKRKRIKKEK